MRSNFTPARVPPGVPAGGQFAPTHRPEAAGIELSDPDLADAGTGGSSTGPSQSGTGQSDIDRHDHGLVADPGTEAFLAERRASIRAGGYVQPAAASRAMVDPRSSAYVRQWWEAEHAVAEYGAETGSYPQMPDDYTPSRGLGHALSGHRRTHRMAYSGAGVSVRMPSVTSIRRYAAELDASRTRTAGTAGTGQRAPVTFDVPVTATHPGGEVTGWVRVTRSPDGSFATRGLGFSKEASAYVAEAIQCLLEARRPTRALADTGDLLERRRRRGAQVGTRPTAVRSSWIKAAGYDKATGTMVLTTATHEYGYRVPPEVFAKVTTSRQPGGVFNQLIRGRATRVEVRKCETCQRFTADMASHRCPPHEAPRLPGTPLQNELARRRFLGGH